MAATLEAVTSPKTGEKQAEKSDAEAARELVRSAREQGLLLTGPEGLLRQLTKTAIETALDEELTGHLGCEKHDTTASMPPSNATSLPGALPDLHL
jgi:putative transposase